MRPCSECGHPLPNHETECDACSARQRLSVGSERAADPASMGRTGFLAGLARIAWFCLELGLRTVLVSIPLSLVLSLVSFFFVWNRSAWLIGTAAGTILALVYALIEMYFHHQLYRGPLG